MSGKKKYSTQLKLQIVKNYNDGKGSYDILSYQYGIERSSIQNWVRLYNKNGMDGLCKVNRTYDGDFKINVLEYIHKHSLSLRQTAAHFNIKNKSTIALWEHIYCEEGKDVLYEERRGRPKMNKKKISKTKNNVQQNEDLLEEVQRLRMEVEYLKKLNALVLEREKSEQKTK